MMSTKEAVALGDELKAHWTLPTALAFLAWFVFAPQCMSTIAVTQARDEWMEMAGLHARISVRA